MKWLQKIFGAGKKVNTSHEKIVLRIDGMHCVSCSLNIDGELSELDGVSSAETVYRTGKTTVTYDPTLVTPKQINAVITSLGYKVLASS